jgi:hypothetical protein
MSGFEGGAELDRYRAMSVTQSGHWFSASEAAQCHQTVSRSIRNWRPTFLIAQP